MCNPRGLFIVGTDTGVGKTFVASLLARWLADSGYRVGVYKPVASGCHRKGGTLISDDALSLWEAAGRPLSLEAVCPQVYSAPLAPPLAARAERRTVDEELLVRGVEPWLSVSDVVLVEGAGGLLSPISENLLVADLVLRLGLPVLVIAANRLGMLNHTLLTIEACRHRGIGIAGIILNNLLDANSDLCRRENRRVLEPLARVPVLADVPWGATRMPGGTDWSGLARAVLHSGTG